MKVAASWNGRQLPPNFEKTLSSPQTDTERKVKVTDLFQTGYKLTTSLLVVIWFAIILVYFGITLHMTSLGGNMYINSVRHKSISIRKLYFSLINYLSRYLTPIRHKR